MTSPLKGALTQGVTVDVHNKENFKRFVEHLDASHDGVWNVANWLNSKGYSVTIPPTTVAKSYEDRMNHVDSGDLFIQQRIEVKTLGINFTCREDWKFGDKFIVCAKHSYDNATPKPYGYIIQSADMKHIAVVHSSTFKQWNVEKRNDSRYVEYTQEFYLCPINLVKFFKV